MQPKCLLITGMGHSGTRLMVNMFAKHPQVSVPLADLNQVEEYDVLHYFFTKAMDATPLSSAHYNINFEELRFILDSYMVKVDTSKPFFILKMPYYPLNCLDFFVDYFKGDVIFMDIQRNPEKVLQTFLRKGEDKTLFSEDLTMLIRQVKKLELKDRKKYFTDRDFIKFFHELNEYVDNKIVQWNAKHPDKKFVEINIEKFAISQDYLIESLNKLGLSTDYVNDMCSVVSKGRLMIKFTGKLKMMVPSAVWIWGSKKFGNRSI